MIEQNAASQTWASDFELAVNILCVSSYAKTAMSGSNNKSLPTRVFNGVGAIQTIQTVAERQRATCAAVAGWLGKCPASTASYVRLGQDT